MYYTWGYIKENALSKLNLTNEDANQLGFLSRFPYYANEAMTQICSSIKARDMFYDITITDTNVNTIITLDDTYFIAFDDDIVQYKVDDDYIEAHDDIFEYIGYNQFLCRLKGEYRIPYRARWFFFTKELADTTVITAPADVCDAIPSYIVSQCYKIDDEIKASIYRNEYEMFLARIDDTSFKSQRTFKVGGGW